jgi:rhodanese-related sulfurtransferase
MLDLLESAIEVGETTCISIMKVKNMHIKRTGILLITIAVLTASSAAQPTQHNHDDKTLTATELKQKIDAGERVVIIDARNTLGGQILKNALHIPLSKLEEWAKTADKNTLIVSYCTCPNEETANAQVDKLRAWGFKHAFSLKGGLEAARSAGFEVVKPSE